MFKQAIVSLAAVAALASTSLAASAQSAMPVPSTAPAGATMMPAQPSTAPMPGGMMTAAPAVKTMAPMGGSMSGGHMMTRGHMTGHHMMMTGPDHGMPAGLAGGDGVTYEGAPDLQGAISLVTAGGVPGHFSVVRAISKMAGAKVANAEVKKLTKQYGAAAVNSFVVVQNFAVDDAVAIATKAGVKFPAPMLHGAALASHVVKLGLVNGTYYEGVQLDHLVTNKIHEAVMGDIDAKYGVAADANYHKIANQAHYDLAQALGATSVKLAPFH